MSSHHHKERRNLLRLTLMWDVPLSHLRWAIAGRHPSPSLTCSENILDWDFMTLKQACLSEYQKAQGAFKDSMIHWILQFTLLIAFRCVLHRCESQEIRCWKFCFVKILLRSLHWCLIVDPEVQQFTEVVESDKVFRPINNDPSAGSPTETLLRLLLPLNNQVWPTSQELRDETVPQTQSNGLTKPFNR